MSRKLWLLCLPLAAVAALFAPSSTDGWSSACGCLNNDAEFAYFVTRNESFNISTANVDLDSQLNETVVAAGFLKRVPLGSSFEEIEKTISFMERSCQLEKENNYKCDYWLQFNKKHERGYSVIFHLSNQKRLISIQAKKIIREKRKNAA